MHCLLIDDDESPRTLMTVLAKHDGHRVTAVASCEQAISAIKGGFFDLAIVDMEMPGPDGASTIAELRQVQPDLRVLVVSGHDDRRYVLAALEAGADGYLLKDDVSELLTATMRDVVAGYTPLSPRVASTSVRHLLRTLGRPVVEARSEPRSHPKLSPLKPPS